MITFIVALSFFAAAWATPAEDLKQFDTLLIEHPEQVWVPNAGPTLKAAIHDYETQKKLPGGATYGDSVRRYSLKNKCASEIEKDMAKMGCRKQVDVIREPVKNEPIKGPSGQPSPIWQFVCADGGVVKVKPEGDPMNKFTPFPHASRTLRYPGDSDYRDYRDEVAKVSEDGHIIPRGPDDLAPKDLMKGWSADAHVPLRDCN